MQFTAATGLRLTGHILLIEGMLWDYCVSRRYQEPEVRGLASTCMRREAGGR